MKKQDINNFFEYNKQELFSVLLDLLDVFKGFCDEHNLHFYAQGGTMLGAVRHHGFIPWDDDIDLAMMRSDFDILLELIDTEILPEPYHFLTPLTDMQYSKGIVRLCNSNTTAISINNAALQYNHGIFIDIFPLDSIPDQRVAFKIYKARMHFLTVIQGACARYHMGKIGRLGIRKSLKPLYGFLNLLFSMHILTKESVFSAFTKTASLYEGKGQKRICLSTFMIIPRYINQRSDYDVEILNMPFENTTIPVPASYDRILRIHYGENYMTPVHEKTMHGDTLFSTTIPYKQFMETYKDDLQHLWLEYWAKRIE